MKNGDRVIHRFKNQNNEWKEEHATVEDVNWGDDYILIRMDDETKCLAVSKCLKVIQEE